ncbi:hypothetical protein [Streptomyces sp. CC208A]|uniref:hypothetical protein n=1 Tax=Streptomyces sp. CC208A TaxID=3044573 RepID=UPI0024A8A8E6|nr:hypothetical protein [Streptomyces sp. CC208A]
MLSRLKATTLVAVTATALVAGAFTAAGVLAPAGADSVTYQADWRWDSAPVDIEGADS